MSKKPESSTVRAGSTRRGFLALLGVGAAAVAIGLPSETDRPASLWTGPSGKPRWIGHC